MRILTKIKVIILLALIESVFNSNADFTKEFRAFSHNNNDDNNNNNNGPRKCFCRIRKMDGKASYNMQCWSNPKDYLVGNCKNTQKSIGNVKA